jgi:hypothetical protein
VERHARGVLRDDAAHVDEKRIGGEVRHRGDERLRVDGRVGFAQIGLEKSDRLVQPPPGLRRRGAGRHCQHARGGSYP